jgi:hypothetical protein
MENCWVSAGHSYLHDWVAEAVLNDDREKEGEEE